MKDQNKQLMAYSVPMFVVFLTAGLVYYFFDYEYLRYSYVTKFQLPLFTGFLTLGGFLLSSTAFIVVRMHDGLYNKPEYKDRVESVRTLAVSAASNATAGLYDDLRNLSKFLLVCIITSLATSFCQFTIGMIKAKIAIAFCWGISAGTSIFALTACYVVYQNLISLFEFQEDNAKSRNTPKVTA